MKWKLPLYLWEKSQNLKIGMIFMIVCQGYQMLRSNRGSYARTGSSRSTTSRPTPYSSVTVHRQHQSGCSAATSTAASESLSDLSGSTQKLQQSQALRYDWCGGNRQAVPVPLLQEPSPLLSWREDQTSCERLNSTPVLCTSWVLPVTVSRRNNAWWLHHHPGWVHWRALQWFQVWKWATA